MEKKKNNFSKSNQMKYIISVMLILITFFMTFAQIQNKTVKAESIPLTDDQVIEYGKGLYKISDENLYNVLVERYNELNPGTPLSAQLNPLTVGSFKNFEGSLDLSKKNIKDISGLYYLKFDKLTTLNLSSNLITGTFGDFSHFSSLKTLDLSNNEFNSFKNNFSNVLENVDLSNNQLREVDLGTLTEDAVIDLSFNKINSFSKITTPTTTCTLKLTHNMITEDLPTTANITFEMGLQGITNNADLIKSSAIKFYSLDGVEKLEVYEKVDENYEYLCDIMPGQSLSDLSINSYKLIFVHTGLEIYSDLLFTVRPNLPTYRFMDKEGNIIVLSSGIINQQCILELSGDDNNNLFYVVNNGQTVNQNKYDILESGSYTITFWQTINGVESLKTTILIISKYYNPLGLIWVLFGILFFVVLFYIGIKWKNSFGKVSKKGLSSNRNFE